jgi:hypothetical protein
MPLLPPLADSVETAMASLTAHSDHALAPHFRHEIYQTFSLLGRPNAVGWLGVITARYVLPIWQSERPEDSLVSQAIDAASLLLQGHTNAIAADELAGEVWDRLEQLGSTPEGFSLGNSFYAADTAVTAIHEALGRNPFDSADITDKDTDAELDPWCSDTALWAAAAYVGRVGDPNSDAGKRYEFWMWWLGEAIPAAWEAASPS